MASATEGKRPRHHPAPKALKCDERLAVLIAAVGYLQRNAAKETALRAAKAAAAMGV